MRVLIVLPGAIGDVVRALPLLALIRRARPDAFLGWSVEPPSAPLLDEHPWLDRVHVFERRRGVRGLLAHARALRATRYHVSIDLGRSAKSALIALGAAAPRRIGFHRADAREASWLVSTERLPPQDVERSKLDQFLEFANLLDVPPGPVEFGLAATPGERARVEAWLGSDARPLIAAPVGSSCPSRRWFPDRTAAALDAVHRVHRTRAVLLGTPADADFGRAVAAQATSPIVDLTGRTSLRDLIAVFERSAAVVGPDSGALHIAAALGKPVVSLWGATSALRSAPHGSNQLVLAGTAPCSPCFLRRCPIGRVCMESIEVEEVRRLMNEALAA